MSYAAPLSRLARSRARADPRPSPQLDVVILSISARFMPRNVAGQHGAIRWPASWATRIGSTCFSEPQCAWRDFRALWAQQQREHNQSTCISHKKMYQRQNPVLFERQMYLPTFWKKKKNLQQNNLENQIENRKKTQKRAPDAKRNFRATLFTSNDI